jgi:phosphatidylglycerol:prolipoprotein diacylglycerol transferase
VHPLVFSSPGAIFLKIGPITIRWYGIMIAIGFLVASSFASFMAKRRGLDADKLVNGCLVAFMCGIAGARLYYCALNWPTFSQHPGEIFATWLGGLSIHGGMVGGLIGGWIYSRWAKLPFLPSIDVVASVVPLAQAIGRWGNFFNSEAYGIPTSENFPLKLYIPQGSRVPGMEMHEYFHPTFLYESVWNLAIFILLYFWLSDRVKAYPGMNFLIYLFLYSVGRFLIEPLRTDSIMVNGIAAPYVVSGILIVASGVGIIFRYTAGKHAPKDPEDAD